MTSYGGNMSDDELFSEDEEQSQLGDMGPNGGDRGSMADRRAHHNALERKRRDHIKDSFSSLRDSVPSLQGEKASRAQILKKAAEYIGYMRRKNSHIQADIDEISKSNQLLEEQIRKLEAAIGCGGSTYSSLMNDDQLSSSYDISEASNESDAASNEGSSSSLDEGTSSSSGVGTLASVAAAATPTNVVMGNGNGNHLVVIKSSDGSAANGGGLVEGNLLAQSAAAGSTNGVSRQQIIINKTTPVRGAATLRNGTPAAGTIILQQPGTAVGNGLSAKTIATNGGGGGGGGAPHVFQLHPTASGNNFVAINRGIHIVNTIPANAAYTVNGTAGPKTKKLKISHEGTATA